jgi:hypothetical protein
MIKGTIIGEMRIDIMRPLNGIWGLLRPKAAKVPRHVAIKVEIDPIKKLFTVPTIHLLPQGVVKTLSSQIPTIYRYHLNDHASGSGGHASIPSVKSIKGDRLKEIGIMAINGAIKKKNTTLQKNKYA